MAEEETTILIMGAGGLGKAYAARSASVGYNVNLYNKSFERVSALEDDNELIIAFDPNIEGKLYPKMSKRINFKPIKDKERLKMLKKEGLKGGTVELNRVSSGKYIEEALEGDPDVILVTTTARGHSYMAKKIAPYLRDDQIVLLNPGRMFGALEFRKQVERYYDKRNGKMPKFVIGEADTSLYACRVDERHDPKTVRIYGVKNKVNFATIPSKDSESILKKVKNIFRQFSCYLDDGSLMNVLNSSIGSVGGVFHVPIMILNAKDITNRKKIKFYKDGLNPTLSGLVEEVDDERVRLAKKLRIHVEPAISWLEREYGSEGATLYEAFQNTDAYENLLAPTSLNVRQLTEEVPCSLIPMMELAKKAGSEYKTTEAFIQIAYILIRRGRKKNILKEARTMKSLGLEKLNIKGIKKYLITGKYPQDEKFFEI
jgi:opine dehydrogenase